ncbi:MAG: hypothetical protein HY832_01760 [Candidatus Aenigmarchaeota archaeon]|nr:hypothetical protein [Candidatus Aenigmarchaeota archaeon]MBI4994741.1 hypothetical protein [Candidatus Peregrinibacteria bacterium]
MKAILVSKKFIGHMNPIVRQTVQKCEKKLRPKIPYVIDVAPTNDKFVIKKMGGSTGWTPSNQKINLDVSTESRHWKKSLESSVAHEFNHVIRMQYLGLNSSNEFTMIDTVAFEGLAQVFEEEITEKQSPYSKAISEKEATKIWKSMKSYKKSDYYWTFFPNSWQKKYPLWCGYTVAYLIVKKRKSELDLTWTELMRLNSKKLVGKGL